MSCEVMIVLGACSLGCRLWVVVALTLLEAGMLLAAGEESASIAATCCGRGEEGGIRAMPTNMSCVGPEHDRSWSKRCSCAGTIIRYYNRDMLDHCG